jgi:hypothetical protein
MKYTFFSLSSPFTLLFLVLSLLVCCNENPSNHSDNTNNISATIFESGGIKPAVGATVLLFSTGSSGEQPVATYTTDDNGTFSIDSSISGCYNIWARKNSFVLFQDSVIISTEYNSLHDDTLESLLSYTGTVQVEQGHDPSTVSIEILGSDRCCKADQSGRFTLSGIASGCYDFLISSTLDGYLPLIRSVSFINVLADTSSDTFSLPYTGIPFIENLTVVEDTLMGVVHLSWKKTSYRSLQDYIVYKSKCSEINNSSTPLCITPDTFFNDTIMHVDTNELPFFGRSLKTITRSDTASQCLRYRVAIRSRQQLTGPSLGYEYQFAPRGKIISFFDYNVVVVNRWCNNHQCIIGSVGDTFSIYLQVKNCIRILKKVTVFNPRQNDTIATFTHSNSLFTAIDGTLTCSFNSAGTHYLHVIVSDNSGRISIDSIPVNVIQDYPVVSVCNDTGVFCGTVAHLYGSATDNYGSITGWKWKIGSSEWATTVSPETTFTSPSTEGELVCQLAAFNDNGNCTIDTIRVFTSKKVTHIDASGNISLFTIADEYQFACGRNESGLFGGTISDGAVFPPVRISSDLQHVAAGASFNLILKRDGTLLGCGNNLYGQLGLGPTATNFPFLIYLRDNVRFAAAGGLHSLILDTDGRLFSCGNNDAGQLGENSMQTQYIPVQIMAGVKTMAAGESHTLALANDGILWACGKNNYGQAGDSSMLDLAQPVPIMSGVSAIATGSNHSLILKSDGSLWACGQNDYGQLGVEITENWSLPVQVTTGVKSIAAGTMHSLILKTDASLWACGSNFFGQLGDSTHINKSTPVLIMTDVAEIATGAMHNLILKTDGTLWGCGSNSYGQLGDIRPVSFNQPIRIIPFQDNTSKRGK